jgi:cytoskeletal protein RodZ
VGKLGDTLRERRISLGVSLTQAEDGTRIRARLIEALEDGDYARLPNPGYVRGYISSYARFLNLDPIPLLALYKSETGAGRFHELDLPQADEVVVPTGQQHAMPARSALVTVLVIALLALAAWAAVRVWRGPEPTPPEPAEVAESAAATSNAAPADEAGGPSTKPATALEPFTLKVVVSKDGASWVKVTIDDKQAYEGTLTGGQSKSFEVAKSSTVAVGKPSSVTILRDGKRVKIPASDDTPTVVLKATKTE